MPGNIDHFEKAMSQGHNAAWDLDWKRAASFYRQALEEFPDNNKALSSLGLAMFEQHEYVEALKYYQRATECEPGDGVSMERVSELHERLGNVDQAIESFLACAEVFIRNKDISKALKQWLHVIQLKPDHLLAHSRLALVYERLGRKQESVAEYLVVAGILQHHGDMQKAIQAVNHALQIAPDAPEALQALKLVRMGRVLPKPSGSRGVTEPLTSPVERQPTRAALPPAVELPDIISEAKQKALAALADVPFSQWDESEDVGRLGMASLTSQASSGYGQLDRGRIVLHISQAVDLQTKKQDVQAIEQLERALDAGLDHPAVFFNLGYLYIQAKRHESGLRFLQRTASFDEYALAAHLLAGQTLLHMERLQEAASELLAALKLADMAVVLPELADGLGQVYDHLIESQNQSSMGQPPVKMCENILDWLSKPNWRAQLKLAREQMDHQENGMLSPLADMLTESSSAQIVDSLIQIKSLAMQGKLRTAIEVAYFALEGAPTYLPLHISIGELLLQQGLYAEGAAKFALAARTYNNRGDANHAVELYRRIVDLLPMDLKLRDELIKMLIDNERFDEAVSEYLRVADIYYTQADLEMTRKTLNEADQLGNRGVDRELRLKILHRRADIELQSLDWRQGMLVYEKIRVLAPGDTDARASLVDLYFRVGQVQQALAEISDFVSYKLERRAFNTVISFLEEMVKTHPRQPSILRQLAEVNQQAGNIEVAVSQYDQAGRGFLEVGNRAAAIETVITILSLNPPNKREYAQLLARLRGE